MEKPRMVHIVQSLQTGGAENLLVNLAVNCKDKFDITVISQYKESKLPLEKRLLDNGIKIIFLNKKVGFDPGSIIALYKALNKETVRKLRKKGIENAALHLSTSNKNAAT